MEFNILSYSVLAQKSPAEIFHHLKKHGTMAKGRLCSRQSVRDWIQDDFQRVFVEYNLETKTLARVYRKEAEKEIWSCDE